MMFTKVIIFLAVWVLAALGMGQNLEGRDNTLRAVADNLEIRGMDEAALIEKFRKLLARDITSTVIVSSCVAVPSVVTIPDSSIPGGDSSIPTTFPTSSTDTDTSIPLPTTFPFSTTIPGLPTTIPGLPTTVPGESGSPVPPPTTPAGTMTPAPAPSGTSETFTLTSVPASAPSHSSSPSTAPQSNNALRNEGLGAAIVAMAVALGTLVAM